MNRITPLICVHLCSSVVNILVFNQFKEFLTTDEHGCTQIRETLVYLKNKIKNE